jgi:fluoroacetyl-CoA thioesterase
MKASLLPGLNHTMEYTVPQTRTVPRLLPESADFAALPQVLATGYMVGIIEWACMEVLHGHLDEGEISLGTHVDLSHDAPTVPGDTVIVEATLVDVAGRVLSFMVDARDDHGPISYGTHQRAVVDRKRFVQRLDRRQVPK